MKPRDFHYRHFLPEVILQCLRWYLRYPISYSNLEEMMIERGVEVDHTTLYRWVQAYSVELAKRIRYYSKPYSTSWRVDETYIKVKGKWKYLYRVVDKYGSTIDFMLSSHRDIAAAKKFFKQVMINSALKPEIITTDKHSSYNKAIIQLKAQKILPNLPLHRQCKYLNNIIESDQFNTARRCIFGIEAMAMMIKKQTHYLRLSILEQIQFVKRLFYIYD